MWQDLDDALFVSPADARDWAQRLTVAEDHNGACETVFIGQAPEFLRLRPSYVDRAAFLELLTKGLTKFFHGATTFSQLSKSSIQGGMYQLFSDEIQQLFQDTNCSTSLLRSKALQKISKKALGGLSFMYVEILNEISMPQVFLWMQEKTLFGMGAFLENKAPGINFDAVDLVRSVIVFFMLFRN